MLINQGHLQVKAAERQWLAGAMAEYFSRNGGEVSEPVKCSEPATYGIQRPMLFGASAKPKKPAKPEEPKQPTRTQLKRDAKAPRIRELAARGWNGAMIARDVKLSRVTTMKIAAEHNIDIQSARAVPAHLQGKTA